MFILSSPFLHIPFCRNKSHSVVPQRLCNGHFRLSSHLCDVFHRSNMYTICPTQPLLFRERWHNRKHTYRITRISHEQSNWFRNEGLPFMQTGIKYYVLFKRYEIKDADSMSDKFLIDTTLVTSLVFRASLLPTLAKKYSSGFFRYIYFIIEHFDSYNTVNKSHHVIQ